MEIPFIRSEEGVSDSDQSQIMRGTVASMTAGFTEA